MPGAGTRLVASACSSCRLVDGTFAARGGVPGGCAWLPGCLCCWAALSGRAASSPLLSADTAVDSRLGRALSRSAVIFFFGTTSTLPRRPGSSTCVVLSEDETLANWAAIDGPFCTGAACSF